MKKSIIISLLLIYRPNEIFKLFSLKNVIVNDVFRKSYLFACKYFPIKLFAPLLFSDSLCNHENMILVREKVVEI